MTQAEKELLSEYFYNMDMRLDAAISDCSYRFVRRDLDELDLLEEILAHNTYKAFCQFANDVTSLLKLDNCNNSVYNYTK